MAQTIAAEDNEGTQRTNLVICPYCDWQHPNSIEVYAGDEGVWDQECGACQKSFRALRLIDVRVICRKHGDNRFGPTPAEDALESLQKEYAWQVICAWHVEVEKQATVTTLEEMLLSVDPTVARLVRAHVSRAVGTCEWCEKKAPLKAVPDPQGGSYTIDTCAWGCPP